MSDIQSDAGEGDGVEIEAAAPSVEDLAKKVEHLSKALAASRFDKKQTQRELAAMRDLMEMKGAEPKTKAERAAEPDPDDDPMAWIKYARDRLREFDARDAEDGKRAEVETRQSAEVTRIVRQMAEYESEFRSEHADYDDAVEHFKKVRAKELVEDDSYSPAEVADALRHEILSTVVRAIKANRDPAAVMYKLAQNRKWSGSSTKETDVTDPKLDKGEKKLQTIEKGQQAGRSLSSGSARQGDGNLTWEHVSSLKGPAFTEAVSKLKSQAKSAGTYR